MGSSHLQSLNALLQTATPVSDVLTQEHGRPEKIGRPAGATALRSMETARNSRWQLPFPRILTVRIIRASDGEAMSSAPEGRGVRTSRLWQSERAPASSVAFFSIPPPLSPTPPLFCNSSGLTDRPHCSSSAVTLHAMKSEEMRQHLVPMVVVDGKSVACAARHLRVSERSARCPLEYFWETGGEFEIDPERWNRHADNIGDNPTLRDAVLKAFEDEPELFLNEMTDVVNALTAGVDGAVEVSPASVSRIWPETATRGRLSRTLFYSQRGGAGCLGCLSMENPPQLPLLH